VHELSVWYKVLFATKTEDAGAERLFDPGEVDEVLTFVRCTVPEPNLLPIRIRTIALIWVDKLVVSCGEPVIAGLSAVLSVLVACFMVVPALSVIEFRFMHSQLESVYARLKPKKENNRVILRKRISAAKSVSQKNVQKLLLGGRADEETQFRPEEWCISEIRGPKMTTKE
jgi:hypothetical protein